ncbi:MAG: GNAT family N-acetyltransferase [Verrucomicrobiia bacterium]
MRLWNPVTRARSYWQRHGVAATLRRAWLGLGRAVGGNRLVLFSCDLAMLPVRKNDLAHGLEFERKIREADLDSRDREQIINFWNPDVTGRQITERFGKGASLWLVRADGRLAGYGWTLVGDTMEPHYVSLGREDVHLFDFLVFPDFRGRGINPTLVVHILETIAGEGRGRAFIEAAGWNTAQLSSLRRTPFQEFAVARKRGLFGKPSVVWSSQDAPGRAVNDVTISNGKERS